MYSRYGLAVGVQQFLELVRADLEDLPDVQAGRKHLFMGRPATASCGASVFLLVGGEPANVKDLTGRKRIIA